MLIKPTEVKAIEKYKIYLRFADDTAGEINLAHLAGKGVFQAWDVDNLFFKVYIDAETNAIAWNEMLEICADNLYLQLKKMTFTEWQQNQYAYATN